MSRFLLCVTLLLVGVLVVDSATKKRKNDKCKKGRVRCLVDPCDGATCAAHLDAVCRKTTCGGCYAKFFVDGNRVSCDVDCRLVRCANPCDGKTCPKYPGATCRNVACKNGDCCGCYRFYESGIPVDCCCTQNIVSCVADPCDVTSCPAYPRATCLANYCGGCYAEYYMRGKRVYNCRKRKVVKPGICPRVRGPGVCVELCRNDASCPGTKKCCSNGCGHVCMAPIRKGFRFP